MLKKSQIIIMSAVLILFAVTSLFIYPQADDFSYAANALKLGFWPSQYNEYMTWNGRFMATFFLNSSPLVWGNLTHYRMLPIILLISMFLSSVFFIKSVFQTKLHKHEEWFFGLALAYLTLTGFHTISEGLYWSAASYTYVVSLVFVALAGGFLFRKNYFAASVCSVFLIGCNETVMVLWLYSLFVLEFFHYLKNKKLRKGHIITFIVSFIVALIVIKSPGNSFRASLFKKSHDVVRTLSNASLYSFIDPIKFISLSMIAFLLLNFERLKELLEMDRLQKYKWHILVLFMGIIFVSFAPSLWGMGRRPNERTMNVIVWFHLVAFFPVAILFIKRIAFKRVAIVLLVLLAFSKNTYTLVKDYFGPIQSYQKRWVRIVETNGEESILKESVPESIYFGDIDTAEGRFFKYFLEKNPNFFN